MIQFAFMVSFSNYNLRAALSIWKKIITDFLNTGEDVHFRKAIRAKWLETHPEDKLELYQFLYNGRLYKLFIYFFALDLRSQTSAVPWRHLSAILKSQDIKYTKVFIRECSSSLTDLVKTRLKINSIEDIYEKLTQQAKIQFEATLANKKNELQASARIAESERLTEQLMFYLGELKKISPQSLDVTSIISDKEKNKATEILKRKAAKKSNIQNKKSNDNDERQLIFRIKRQINKFITSGKYDSTDFAVLFRLFGAPRIAAEFIYLNEPSTENDWRILDYLFHSQQYLTLLDHSQYLKQKYSGQPDSLFSVLYLEAISYWELGEKEKAFNIMSEISSMRPNFKSATEILSQWEEERFD